MAFNGEVGDGEGEGRAVKRWGGGVGVVKRGRMMDVLLELQFDKYDYCTFITCYFIRFVRTVNFTNTTVFKN